MDVSDAKIEESTNKNENNTSLDTIKQESSSPELPESRSLVIYGIPKRFKVKAFEKILKELNIKFNRVIIPNRQLFAKIKFESPEDRKAAQEKLEGYKINDCVLHVKKPHDKSIIHSNKKRKVNEDQPKSIVEVVTPWHEIPYEVQLKKKEVEITSILRRITSIAKSRSTQNIPKWLSNLKSNDKCCDLEPIIPSPAINEYVIELNFYSNH